MDIFDHAVNSISTGAIILLCFFVVVPFIVACVTCATMASRLGRSPALWVFLSLFSINPIVCILCLYGLGETNEHRRQRIIEEEEWKNKVNVGKYLSRE